jgi:hypothetical protein
VYGSSGYNVKFNLNVCVSDCTQQRQKIEGETGKQMFRTFVLQTLIYGTYISNIRPLKTDCYRNWIKVSP